VGADRRQPVSSRGAPAFDSADTNAQYGAVKNLQSTNATNHLVLAAGFLSAAAVAGRDQDFQNHLDSNPPQAARVYALQAIAQHDATLAC
jgi:hypothetical protein